MHRRLWLLAGAAAAVMLLAASATATTKVAGSARGAESSAAPFAQSWAKVPQTTAGRKAKSVLVFGVEQDINGFNTVLACCNQLIGGFMGAAEAQHGAFNQNEKGVWFKDLVSAASATKTSLSYTIKPNANWYWGGKKLPVTYKDFVYTLQKIDDPATLVAGRTGYSNIDTTNFTHKGQKQVTFHWKTKSCTQDFPCGPYANWQSLFSGLYPAAALAGQDFNKIWTDCICGSDGKPVSNGPFYLTNYTKGQGTTLKANPFWAGKKPGLAEVDFKIITDTNTEVQAMRGGEVDAITPTFGSNLLPLKGQAGITFNQIPGYYFEHLEYRETKGTSNVLLRAPWMRQAISLGIDRAGIIKTVYGDLAGNTQPMNNMIYYSTQAAYKPDFAPQLQRDQGARPPEEALHRWACNSRCRWNVDLLGSAGEVPLVVDRDERHAHEHRGDRQVRAQVDRHRADRVPEGRERDLRPDRYPGRRLRYRRVRQHHDR